MIIPDILLLKPNRVWRTYSGGKYLDIMESKPAPADSHFPEDWIASTIKATNIGREHIHDEGYSRVDIQGQFYYLKDLFQQFPREFLGDDHYKKFGPNTQFLTKLLDSAIRLHLQAHPTISFSKKYLNSNSGKTEAYVILSVREEIKDPYVLIGFQNPLSKAAFRETVLHQDINKLLGCFDKTPVAPGDVFVVPGGLPHAIGEGILMIEIMEPTDFVVRLEFERGGYALPEQSRFMGRNIDFALEMINFDKISSEEVKQNWFCSPAIIDAQEQSIEYSLIDSKKTACFSVNKLEVKKRYSKTSDSFYIGVVTSGSGRIDSSSQHYDLKTGDKFLVTYTTEEVHFTAGEELQVYLMFPPK
jgi:mannose-6-phosphate isomerase